jgi:putative transposase
MGIRAKLARTLQVGRSSTYYHPIMPTRNELLKVAVQTVQEEHPAYGHKRIALELGRSKNQIHRVMKLFGLTPHIVRKHGWSAPKEPSPARPNFIREIAPNHSNHIWASDFTYLYFQGRWYYLATILDLFTRRIIGWHIGRRHTAQLVHLAVCDALSRHMPPSFFHADQGSEYTAAETIRLVEATGAKASFSAKGSPWQNGYQESFYQNYKLELGDLGRFEHEGELFEAVAKQIYYYNYKRIHTALKMSPMRFYERELAGAGMRQGVERMGT